MTYRTSRKLGNVLMGAAAVSLVDHIQARPFYRCPHCGGRFDMREEPRAIVRPAEKSWTDHHRKTGPPTKAGLLL